MLATVTVQTPTSDSENTLAPLTNMYFTSGQSEVLKSWEFDPYTSTDLNGTLMLLLYLEM